LSSIKRERERERERMCKKKPNFSLTFYDHFYDSFSINKYWRMLLHFSQNRKNLLNPYGFNLIIYIYIFIYFYIFMFKYKIAGILFEVSDVSSRSRIIEHFFYNEWIYSFTSSYIEIIYRKSLYCRRFFEFDLSMWTFLTINQILWIQFYVQKSLLLLTVIRYLLSD